MTSTAAHGGVIIVIAAAHFLLRNEWIDKVHKVM